MPHRRAIGLISFPLWLSCACRDINRRDHSCILSGSPGFSSLVPQALPKSADRDTAAATT